MNAPDDRTEELLTQALHSETASIEATPGALQEIQRRTRASSTARRHRWMWGGVAAAGVATAAVVTGVVVFTGGDPSTPATDGSNSRVSLEITYFGRSGGGEGEGEVTPRLYTETHVVPGTEPTPSAQAVHEFLTSGPYDDDYMSGWPGGVDVQDVSTDAEGLTTIALQGEADLTNIGSLAPYEVTLAIQALLHTAGVDEAAVITYNGSPLTELFGTELQLPLKLLPDDDTRAWISIDGISDGQELSNPVRIDVTANVFEGNVNWSLLDETGTVVDEGFVTTSMGDWSTATANLGNLAAGTYTFRAFEISMEDGSELFADDKTFTIP